MANDDYVAIDAFENDRFVGSSINISRDQIVIFGSNAVFENCKITIATLRNNFMVQQCELVGCSIEAKKKMLRVGWSKAILRNCSFLGNFEDCDFGPRANLGGDDANGALKNVDFRSATLDYCRFFAIDLKDVILPNWPVVSIVDPRAAVDDIRKNGEFSEKPYFTDFLSDVQKDQKAICFVAKTLAKQLGCSEADLKDFLVKKSYAIL